MEKTEYSFNVIRNKLNDILLDLKNNISEKIFIDRIDNALNRLERETMNLLIVGEFSRGKSTFINALLQSPVLPSKVNPTTATINLIKGGEKKEMLINYRDGNTLMVDLPELI